MGWGTTYKLYICNAGDLSLEEIREWCDKQEKHMSINRFFGGLDVHIKYGRCEILRVVDMLKKEYDVDRSLRTIKILYKSI